MRVTYLILKLFCFDDILFKLNLSSGQILNIHPTKESCYHQSLFQNNLQILHTPSCCLCTPSHLLLHLTLQKCVFYAQLLFFHSHSHASMWLEGSESLFHLQSSKQFCLLVPTCLRVLDC